VPERVVIVADEAYFEFARDPEYPNSLDDHDGRRLLITMRTFSKIFGLAGLRVGYVVARREIVRLLNNVRQPFNVNSLAQVAVMAGMDDHDHARRTLENNRAGIQYLEAEFARLKLGFLPSQANFILVEVGHGRAVYGALLAKGVIVRPMEGYGLPRHVRISVGLEAENRKLVAALSEAIGKRL
jgi:histidinol-phosphate aminotransferase